MDDIIRVAVSVFGKVQGVFYRASAKKFCENLEISGFVRNESDGSVYLEIQGVETEVAKVLAWCKKGPPLSVVSRIQTTGLEVVEDSGFRIQRG